MPRIRLGHTVGVELLELVQLLAGGGERDRPADDFLDRQCRTAACVAVHLRHDHAVDLQGLVERLGSLHGVLAGHRVDDQERVVRVDCAGDQAHLLHHLGVDRQTTRRVDDDDVAPEPLGLFHAGRSGEDRILGIREHRHVDLASERAELFDRSGALEVRPDHDRVATLRLEPLRELGRVGGLARTLQPGHQHDRRRLGRIGDGEGLAAECTGQLVVHGLDDLLAGVERLRPRCADGMLADAVAHRPHDGDVDVGFEQRRADLFHHLVDVGLGETALAANLGDDAFEAVGQIVEHRRQGYRPRPAGPGSTPGLPGATSTRDPRGQRRAAPRRTRRGRSRSDRRWSRRCRRASPECRVRFRSRTRCHLWPTRRVW